MTPTLEELGLDRLPPAERRALAAALLASLQPEPKPKVTDAERGAKMAAIMRRMAARGGVQSIPDPVAWQREQREDRELPGRGD